MRKRFKQSDALAGAILAGTIALTCAVYVRLPPRIPVHFDIHGVANGWMSRSLGAWVLPAVSVGLWVLLRLLGRVLPDAWRARMDDSPTAIAATLLVALFSSLQCVILYAALEQPRSVGTAMSLLLEGFWIALGLILPRLRRNPWIGVRTPWTLSSDEIWARTHRFAGYAFTVGGGVALLSTLAGSPALSIAALLASALVPAGYSFLLARRLPPEA